MTCGSSTKTVRVFPGIRLRSVFRKLFLRQGASDMVLGLRVDSRWARN